MTWLFFNFIDRNWDQLAFNDSNPKKIVQSEPRIWTWGGLTIVTLFGGLSLGTPEIPPSRNLKIEHYLTIFLGLYLMGHSSQEAYFEPKGYIGHFILLMVTPLAYIFNLLFWSNFIRSHMTNLVKVKH